MPTPSRPSLPLVEAATPDSHVVVTVTASDASRVRALPDVWERTARGVPWCDCGEDHPLTREAVEWATESLYGLLPDRLTHPQVVAVAAEVWALAEVCRFFTLQVEDAALDVNGSVETDYPLPVGLAIVKAFSDAWNGCPEEQCHHP